VGLRPGGRRSRVGQWIKNYQQVKQSEKLTSVAQHIRILLLGERFRSVVAEDEDGMDGGVSWWGVTVRMLD
jgi:hypothetical protein